jgi:hypothetical protein
MLRVVVERAEGLEVAGASDGGLDAQDAAGLVVHLDGVSPDPMFDADALGAVLETGDDLSGEASMGLAAEETHHVGGS